MTALDLHSAAAPDYGVQGGDLEVRWLLSAVQPDVWVEAIDYWSDFLVASGVRPLTIELRRYQIGHLAEAYLDRSPRALRCDDLLRWMAGQDWAPETRKSYRSALRSFYSWAVESGQAKGGKVRIVPMHPMLAAPLAAERERRIAGRFGTGYRYTAAVWPDLFPGRSGGPMTPDAVGRAASRALGDGWTAHTLRHRFATRAYAGSHDLLAVQALLGHTNPETTKRYTELTGDALAAAVRTV